MTLGPGLRILLGGRLAVPILAAALAATLLAFPGPAAADDHGHHDAYKVGKVVGALLHYAYGGKYHHKSYHGYKGHHYKSKKYYHKKHSYKYGPNRYYHKKYYRKHHRGHGYHRGHDYRRGYGHHRGYHGGYRHRYGYGGRHHP